MTLIGSKQSPLLFCTSNEEKFSNAQKVCEQYGIALQQVAADIDEIQVDDGELIARDKATKAYAEIKQPLVVSDDSWDMPGLRGFPGPYMKSINQWLTPEDLLRLTAPLKNRRVYLTQYLVYIDTDELKVFALKSGGTLQYELRGNHGRSSHKLVAMDGDGGLTIAEVYDRGLDNASREVGGAWQQLAAWYSSRG